MQCQSTNRMLSYYAKLLLVFSIVLLVCGISLEVKESSKSKPSRVIQIINQEEDENVSVTPFDGTEVVSNDNTEVDSKVQNNVADENDSNLSISEKNQKLQTEIQNTYFFFNLITLNE